MRRENRIESKMKTKATTVWVSLCFAAVGVSFLSALLALWGRKEISFENKKILPRSGPIAENTPLSRGGWGCVAFLQISSPNLFKFVNGQLSIVNGEFEAIQDIK